MRSRFFSLFFLLLALPAWAQEADLETFLKRFPKASLPYSCAVNPKAKLKKTAQITANEAKQFLTGFTNPTGHNVNHYESLIEPFEPTKNEEGKVIMSKASGQIIALLQRTNQYILFLTRVAFEERNMETMEGEQYLLHSISPDGSPITVLPIAQKVQFDLHSNQAKGEIDAQGNITVQIEIYTVSGTEKITERYKIQPDGKIILLKP